MLPVDGRQLEHVREEPLKLLKKERSDWQKWLQRNQERRAKETEERRSRRLAAMAQRDQERRAEEMEEQRSH
ncbi:uncharacterized protein TNCV_4414001 [Trichonephila clavipes]|uniref:Uncharacterized protein n=1 Tax=Trichonephila clavipes TaxID=2585209 RepID=A0A8X6V4C5_TRICX|nr:uncharacterized protein TNCV_4414001 [Trichonephila clavipes]